MPANSRIMDQIVKQGRFVLAVALMASGAEQLICARSALPVRYSIPWAPGSQGLHPRILGEINEQKDGQDDRIGNLRTGCRAECTVADSGAGHQNTVSEHGPACPVPDAAKCRHTPRAERGPGVHLTRCRPPRPWQACL